MPSKPRSDFSGATREAFMERIAARLAVTRITETPDGRWRVRVTTLDGRPLDKCLVRLMLIESGETLSSATLAVSGGVTVVSATAVKDVLVPADGVLCSSSSARAKLEALVLSRP